MKIKHLTIALVLVVIGAVGLHAQTATPTFNYADGTYAMPKSITVSDSTSGATISWCYIASGTCTPNTTYTAAIYVNPTTSETICANATASSVTSATACAVYRNSTATATSTPTIGLASGTYTFPQITAITDSGATILWCTTTSSSCTPGTTYSSSITISSAETICADGLTSGESTSAIVCNTYTSVTGGSQITGAGTSGVVPAFTGSATIGNSPLAMSGSNVGIGTTGPEAPMTVASFIQNGLGTNISVNSAFWTGADVNLVLGGDLNGSSTPYLQSRAGGSSNVIGSSGYKLALNPYGGSVGIGTVSPSVALEINGSVKLTSGSSGSMTYADGTVQTTAWTGVLCGGDYAEAVLASGSKRNYEPGDVLVLDSDANGKVEKSSEPYSTLVAGIYATKPGVIGRRQSLLKDEDQLPMAMVGIVPTKVSAENGPIRQGDLLVSSSIRGYAMKGTDRMRMLGAVIGKAMGTLDSGTGVVEVLVTLQ